jgi:succinate-semialdehyde dehydrogenase/glutarate-semialdehyde dehydrogenase
VLDDVEASFIEALAQEALAWADPERVGPLVDEQARASVHGVVASSVAEGAIAVVGGAVPDGPGAYYPPTVLARCTPLMQAMRTEARGPVAAVMTVHNFEEALAEAAEPPIGPSATVLTQDIGHAQLAVAELPVATLVINGIAQSTTDAPSLPQSGMPTDFGPGLLDELSRSKSVHLEPPVAARARRH